MSATATISPPIASAQTARDKGTGKDIGFVAKPPLDFSFKELRTCSEMETEEPRSGGKPRRPTDKDSAAGRDPAETAAEAPAVAPDPKNNSTLPPAGTSSLALSTRPDANPARSQASAQTKVVVKKTIAVKLNNNHLETVHDLPAALEFFMETPLLNLRWIDLSFNRLRTIEPALLEFQQLKALYLHGNLLQHCSTMERLINLPHLMSLTSNGNPMESRPFYRSYILGCLPQIRSLDHSTITEDEKEKARCFWQDHLRNKDRYLKEREEMRLGSME